MIIFVMLTPIALTDKISHLLTLLLTITVYQLILLDQLPASEEISLAGNIIQGVFISSTILIFVSFIVQIFNYETISDKLIPLF